MTSPDLDAIEARANAATPGPWVAQNYDDDELDGNWPCCDRVGRPDSAKALAHVVLGSDDAEFIAHAREDVPVLIARIREICPHYSWSGWDAVDTYIGVKHLSFRCDSCGLVTHDPNEIEEDHL
jgi:hypothetical protein